jgi:hypothetical protein
MISFLNKWTYFITSALSIFQSGPNSWIRRLGMLGGNYGFELINVTAV